MSPLIKILILEHSICDIELLEYELTKGGINYEAKIVENEMGYGNALRNFFPDIILSDYSLPSFDGAEAFKMREEISPDIPFIFVSGNIGEENSIEYIKNGVTDYVLKDKLFTLTTKVERALKESKEKQKKNITEQELVQSERQLAKAQQVAHIGSWESDLAINDFHVSDEACRIFGVECSKNVLSFETWSSLIHAEDREFVLNIINESLTSLKDFSYSYRIVQYDSRVRNVYSESKFEFGSNGKPTGLYGIVHDVTEIKLAETERTKMMYNLVQRNKELEQFAYIVSHNLRAPIANILGAANVLNDPGLSIEKKALLNDGLKESATRLDNVVRDLNDILDVKGEINEAKEKVHFSELVADIKVSIKDLIDINSIEIKYDFSEVDEFLTLKSYLQSIFFNLISNSIKYRQQQLKSIVKIKSHQVKNKIQLIFSDNGMGIDLKRSAGQVFGLYKRFHTNIEGKGIGLFLVKTQVEALGGRINIKSKVNKGTEFKIEFEV